MLGNQTTQRSQSCQLKLPSAAPIPKRKDQAVVSRASRSSAKRKNVGHQVAVIVAAVSILPVKGGR